MVENELVVICALIICCLVVATDCLRAICNRLRTLLKSGFFLSLASSTSQQKSWWWWRTIVRFIVPLPISYFLATHFYFSTRDVLPEKWQRRYGLIGKKKCNVYSELWINEVGINQHLQFRFYEKPLCLSSSRSAYLSIAMPTNTLSYEELLLQSAEGQEGEENASAQQQQLLL